MIDYINTNYERHIITMEDPIEYYHNHNKSIITQREIGVDVPVGQMVGELGFLSPDNHRTLTLECVRAGDVLSIHYQDLRQLFFQNPEFGFYFLRLTSGRLFENLARLEGELASLRDAVPAGTVPGRPG